MAKDSELIEKERRLWAAVEEKQLDGVLISRRSNFAWMTAGGDAHVFLASETGACSLLVTKEGKTLLAHSMDGDRMIAEELAGQDVALRAHKWFEGRAGALENLTRGLRVGSDTPQPGMLFLDEAFWRELEFPLLPAEIERAREIGRLADRAMGEVAASLEPGITELEIGGRLAGAFIRLGIYPDVLLVGSDERLYRYRHCTPTSRPVEKLVLMHVAGQKYGLHANVTRMVHFGPQPEELRRRHQAVSYIHSQVLAHLRPGFPFRELLEVIQQGYASTGFASEWQGHLQGGIAGYEACYPFMLLDDQAVIGTNQAYDWLITVPGTKTEELSLLTEAGVEVASLGPDWPAIRFEHGDFKISLPDILER